MAQVDNIFSIDVTTRKQAVVPAPRQPANQPAVVKGSVPQTATRSNPITDPVINRVSPAGVMSDQGMNLEDRSKLIENLQKEKRELMYGHIIVPDTVRQRRREIDEQLNDLAYSGFGQTRGLQDLDKKLMWDSQGIEQSNITPWEWGPGFFAGGLIRHIGRTTLKGAVTRAGMVAAPMAVTETGAEIVAEAVAPDSPWVNLAVSLGLGMSVGNFLEAVIDRKSLKLLNSKYPNFFSTHLESALPKTTKNISKIQQARMKVLAERIDAGDMVALREVKDILKKAMYRDAEQEMTLKKFADATDIEKTRKQINRDFMKKSFGDLDEKDLEAIQDLAHVKGFKGFDEEFTAIRERATNRLAEQTARDHPIQGLVQEVGRGGGFNEQRMVSMLGQDIVDDLKKKYQYLITSEGSIDPIKTAVRRGYYSMEEMAIDLGEAPTAKQIKRSISNQLDFDWQTIYHHGYAKRINQTEMKMWEDIAGKNVVRRIQAAVKKGQPLFTAKTKRIGDIIDEAKFIKRVSQKASKAGLKITKATERIRALAKAAALSSAKDQMNEIAKINAKWTIALKNNNIPEEFQEQIHRYLKPYTGKRSFPSPDAPSLRNFVDEQVEQGGPLAKLFRKQYEDVFELPQMTPDIRDITMPQLKKIEGMIDDLQKIGRKMNQLETRAMGKTVSAYVTQMGDEADLLFKQPHKFQTQRDWVGEKLPWRKRKAKALKERTDIWASELVRPENVLRELGGWKDFSEPEKMFRAVKLAEDMEFQTSKVLGDRWQAIIGDYAKQKGAKLNNKFWDKTFKDSKSDFTIKREHMIVMAAMTGNDHNKQAMLRSLAKADGTPMDAIQVNRVLRENMDVTDWKLVKDIWKMTDEMYDLMAKPYKRMTGNTLPKVKNYFPLVADYKFTKRQKKASDYENVEDAYMSLPHMQKVRPGVQKRFFKTRVGGMDSVNMTFDAFGKHLRDVAHTTSHWEITSDLNKVIRHPRFEKAVRENLGDSRYEALTSWVEDLMKAPSTNAPFLRALRGRATVAMLGWKLSTALVQPLSMVSAIPRVGKGNLAVALARFAKNPRKVYRTINELSEQMAGRNKAYHRDIRDLMSTKWAKNFKKMGTLDRNKFFSMIRAGDILGSYTTWYAGWLRGIKKFDGNQNKAIAYADQSVRLTQPQSSIKDLPKVMRSKNEWKRLLTMFYSYYSVLHNQGTELYRRFKVGDASGMEAMGALNYMYIIPPMIRSLMQDREAADPMTTLKGVGSHIAGGIPIARDIASGMIHGYDYMTTPGGDVFKQLIDSGQTLGRMATKDDYEFKPMDLEPFIRFAGEAGGLPSGQFMTIMRGLLAEDAEDKTPLDIFLRRNKSKKKKKKSDAKLKK